jgi:Carboxypeptidase regulatory-like domain
MRRVLAFVAAAAALAFAGCSGETNPATNVTNTTATLHGTVSCNNGDSGTWWWEYRRAGASWTQTAHQAFNCTSSSGNVPVSKAISGLTPNSHYTFQLASSLNGGATIYADSNGYATTTETDPAATYDAFDTGPDASPPTLDLSGSLAALADQALASQYYDLHVDAKDGDPSSPSSQQSGVKSIEILIDGQRQDYAELACPAGNCAMTRDWTFNASQFAVGDHTVQVVATDQLGHQSDQSFAVTLSDQTDPETIIDETSNSAPANPTPVDGAASATSSSQVYTSPEESTSSSGLMAYSSTESGTTALTGTILDSSGNPVNNASITLAPSAGGSALAATSDSAGAFAFVAVPVNGSSQSFDMTVNASGYGAYRVINDVYNADETYETSVELDTSAQTYDESTPPADSTVGATSADGPGGYPSNAKVPPTITVHMLPHTSLCAPASSTGPDRTWPWRYYILHVGAGELDSRFRGDAYKANAEAQQSYAWYHKIHQDTDINNTTNFQCFKPHRKVPVSRWKKAIIPVLKQRIALAGGSIQDTEYRAGSYSCNDSVGFNKLSQLGSLYRAEHDACGGNESWQAIDQYYYTGTVDGGVSPDGPDHSLDKNPSGTIDFHFSAVGAWEYQLQRTCGGSWCLIADKDWSWKARHIGDSFTYDPHGNCHKYRVLATNPNGGGPAMRYNDGNTVCPL